MAEVAEDLCVSYDHVQMAVADARAVVLDEYPDTLQVANDFI